MLFNAHYKNFLNQDKLITKNFFSYLFVHYTPFSPISQFYSTLKLKLQKSALFFRAGKEGNLLLPVRRKSSQIKTPNILVKNKLRPIY